MEDIKKDIIVLDIKSMPNGWDLKKWLDIMNQHGLCIIDSFNKGETPRMLHPKRKFKYKIVEYDKNKDK